MNAFIEKILVFALDILARLSLSNRQKIGNLIGEIINLVPSREHRIARAQLARFLPGLDSKAIIRKIYRHLGIIGMELPNLDPLKNNVRVENEAELAAMMADRTSPVVCLTAHMGNWELTAAYLIARGVDLAAVGRVTRNSLVHTMINYLRTRYGLKMLWRVDRAGLGDIMRTLKRNAWLGSLIDQDTQVSGIDIPFFGQPAHTPVTLVQLGKRASARFMSCFVVREKDGGYRGFFQPIDSTLNESEILSIYHQRLEALIRLYPEQWVWFHKRWRTQRNGERLSTKKYLEWLAAGCPDSPLPPSSELPAGERKLAS